MFSPAGFVWLFFQYLCNRSTFLLQVWPLWSVAMLAHSFTNEEQRKVSSSHNRHVSHTDTCITHRHMYHTQTYVPQMQALFFFISTYPLTVRVIGTPQVTSWPVSSILFCSQLPSGMWQTQVCSFPDFVFPPLLLSTSTSSPFHCAFQDGFFFLATSVEQETCPHPLHLHLFTMVRRSSCGPISNWILPRTSLLVTWSLYEIGSIL